MPSIFKRISEDRDIKTISRAIGCDPRSVNPIENLTISTIIIAKQFPGKSITANSYTLCDSILVATFIIQALCVSYIQDREDADSFRMYYIGLIKKGLTSIKGLNYADVSDMMKNRFTFYDELIKSTG